VADGRRQEQEPPVAPVNEPEDRGSDDHRGRPAQPVIHEVHEHSHDVDVPRTVLARGSSTRRDTCDILDTLSQQTQRRGGVLSEEARIAFAPTATYRELLAHDRQVGWRRALERPAFVVLLMGTLVSIAATGRVSFRLVAFTAIAWSFAVALQLALAAILIASAPARRSRLPRALDLWFAGHLPWSLWLLVATPIVTLVPSAPLGPILASTLLAIAWTAAIAAAFCRTVLGTTRQGSWLRAAIHQVLMVVLVLGYVSWAAGGWFRLMP
jgi:hypothetical protein